MALMELRVIRVNFIYKVEAEFIYQYTVYVKQNPEKYYMSLIEILYMKIEEDQNKISSHWRGKSLNYFLN